MGKRSVKRFIFRHHHSFEFVFAAHHRAAAELSPTSVRLNLGSAWLVLKQDIQYTSNVHLRLSVCNDEPNLTRAELGLTVETLNTGILNALTWR